jgi:hypothetical protein
MRGVGESTKGKIKALDLYVCLFLHASLVQLKHACAKKTVHFKFFSAVGYSANKILSALGYNARKSLAL